jgi:amino acid transporter
MTGEPSDKSPDGPGLTRHIGLGALVLYGVGDMLGAGVYGLIGSWAGTMGNALWIAFLTSMTAAVFTGLSYASLGSRYPRAAGAAYITHRAFDRSLLSYIVGLAVVASGLTSMAAQSRAFAGYVCGFLDYAPLGSGSALLPEAPRAVWIGFILLFIVILTAVNLRGIRESTWLNILCTAIEAGGLLLVIAVGLRFWGSVDYFEVPPPPEGHGVLTWSLVLQGGVLTFYSFIGFEDMINVTEEVKEPRRTFPIAVVLALAITSLVYVSVAITAVSVVPYAELKASGQPLVDVVRRAAPAFPTGLFSLVALFAIANTSLLNYIMGSRVIYGMAREGLLPSALGAVHPTRRTPHRAILLLMVIVTALALSGNIRQLALATSVLLLLVFIVVNASLIILKRRPGEPRGDFEIPSIIPFLGILVCAVMLGRADSAAWKIAGILLAGIVALYVMGRARGRV